MKRIISLILFTFILISKLNANEIKKSNIATYTNLGLTSILLYHGYHTWGYGERNFHFGKEKWFQRETKTGGSDKLGHMYTAYLTARATASIYEYYGYSKEEALKEGLLTSFIFTTIMEVGDGFSGYGFSYEDFILNTLGQYIAYKLESSKELDELFDLRLEYAPSRAFDEGRTDPVTDYHGMKHLIALKLNGIDRFKDTQLKWFEIHLGYYTRGYQSAAGVAERKYQRHAYVGFGLNVSKVLNSFGMEKTSKIFKYYQLPNSYIEYSKDFDINKLDSDYIYQSNGF